MPTYDYQCLKCGSEKSVFQTVAQYCRAPERPQCCGDTMDRRLSVNPMFSGLANALAGDRHYEGLRAPDGTDISSRTKHREYMKAKGLTTADDFTGVWEKAEKERQAFRSGNFEDKELHSIVEEQVMRAVAQPD